MIKNTGVPHTKGGRNFTISLTEQNGNGFNPTWYPRQGMRQYSRVHNQSYLNQGEFPLTTKGDFIKKLNQALYTILSDIAIPMPTWAANLVGYTFPNPNSDPNTGHYWQYMMTQRHMRNIATLPPTINLNNIHDGLQGSYLSDQQAVIYEGPDQPTGFGGISDLYDNQKYPVDINLDEVDFMDYVFFTYGCDVDFVQDGSSASMQKIMEMFYCKNYGTFEWGMGTDQFSNFSEHDWDIGHDFLDHQIVASYTFLFEEGGSGKLIPPKNDIELGPITFHKNGWKESYGLGVGEVDETGTRISAMVFLAFELLQRLPTLISDTPSNLQGKNVRKYKTGRNFTISLYPNNSNRDTTGQPRTTDPDSFRHAQEQERINNATNINVNLKSPDIQGLNSIKKNFNSVTRQGQSLTEPENLESYYWDATNATYYNENVYNEEYNWDNSNVPDPSHMPTIWKQHGNPDHRIKATQEDYMSKAAAKDYIRICDRNANISLIPKKGSAANNSPHNPPPLVSAKIDWAIDFVDYISEGGAM